MAKINAGKYRHRITIRNAPTDSSRNTFGERTGTGTTVATVWAEKTDWNGSEVDEMGRETPVLVARWKTRYRSDVTAAMQIVHGSDVYEITSPPLDFDGTRREIVIEARKVN